jgi:hypothetical protein
MQSFFAESLIKLSNPLSVIVAGGFGCHLWVLIVFPSLEKKAPPCCGNKFSCENQPRKKMICCCERCGIVVLKYFELPNIGFLVEKNGIVEKDYRKK